MVLQDNFLLNFFARVNNVVASLTNIERLKKFKGSSENGDLEEIADLEFLRTIDPDYLIID